MSGVAENTRLQHAPIVMQGRAIGIWRQAAAKLMRHRLGCIGLCGVVALAAIAIAAPLIAPYDPTAVFYDAILDPPSWHHVLGTDDLGRDILSRILYGARISLEVIGLSVGGAVVIGSVIGLVCGYAGGWVDQVVMRVMDGMLAFPMLVLALGIISILGPSLANAVIAITVVNIPGFARLVRGQVILVRELDYVQAAHAVGATDMRVIAHHIWPEIAGHVIVYASLRGSAALIAESSLAFLGLGAQPPTPSWGGMLTTAMQYWDAWWMSVFPGAAICLTVLALNFLGDGLRDALDTQLQDS